MTISYVKVAFCVFLCYFKSVSLRIGTLIYRLVQVVIKFLLECNAFLNFLERLSSMQCVQQCMSMYLVIFACYSLKQSPNCEINEKETLTFYIFGLLCY